MTTLATHPVDDPDQLALIADDWTMTREALVGAFYETCWTVANEADGWVDVNRVRFLLIARFGEDGYNPRQLSALWSTACARDGYLDKTDRLLRIEGAGSRGNGNKSVPLRRWRGWVSS